MTGGALKSPALAVDGDDDDGRRYFGQSIELSKPVISTNAASQLNINESSIFDDRSHYPDMASAEAAIKA